MLVDLDKLLNKKIFQSVKPEFPTTNGKIDFKITKNEATYYLEIKHRLDRQITNGNPTNYPLSSTLSLRSGFWQHYFLKT